MYSDCSPLPEAELALPRTPDDETDTSFVFPVLSSCTKTSEPGGPSYSVSPPTSNGFSPIPYRPLWARFDALDPNATYRPSPEIEARLPFACLPAESTETLIVCLCRRSV